MGKEYDTLDMIDNFLTLDEFVKQVKDIAKRNSVDEKDIRICAFDDQISIEEEYEL